MLHEFVGKIDDTLTQPRDSSSLKHALVVWLMNSPFLFSTAILSIPPQTVISLDMMTPTAPVTAIG